MTARAGAAAVTLSGVTKRYGTGPDAVDALSPIELELEPGEVVAVIGPSGCGKTSLLRIVAGLMPPSEGVVLVDDRRAWRGSERGEAVEDLAVVFQEANLLPWATVEANVAFPLRLRGVRRRERLELARQLCERTGLAGFERHRPDALSIGMRHRASLARATIERPRLLLLDEPFAALDAITREQMNLHLQDVLAEVGCTCLLITHSISEAVLLADRVVSLTARPGTVAGITTVPFARPRVPELQHEAEFQTLVADIRRILVEVSPDA